MEEAPEVHFLLLMKMRTAPRPYFAVWVDNAEVLDPR
jgi:hypothetical protein